MGANTPRMPGLKDRLIGQIGQAGPMRLDHYMAQCLLDPAAGYYATRDPFGRAGDFITAPEISQMFGEMLGLALAQVWLDQGGPDVFTLAECGPGRGTLMADMLRAMRSVPGMHRAARVHLVEASATLRAVQRSRLPGVDVVWHDSVDTLPDAPVFLVANEFFDALPIRQFHRVGALWAETQVGVVADDLAFGLAPPTAVQSLLPRLDDTRDGDIVELCPAAGQIVEDIARRIATFGGVAFIVDYGEWDSLGDTFQALKSHAPCDPLAAPGEADLTAHVAFHPLAEAAVKAGTAASAMVTQGAFLNRLGLWERAQILAERLTDDALKQHIGAYRRLTHPEEMGELFKVLALYPHRAALPPGVDASAGTGR